MPISFWLDHLGPSHPFRGGAGGELGQRSSMTPANRTPSIPASRHRTGAELTRPRGEITINPERAGVVPSRPPHRSPGPRAPRITPPPRVEEGPGASGGRAP